MILPAYNKVVFYGIVLISLILTDLKGQSQPNDTLKKVSVDSVATNDEEDIDEIDEKIIYSAEDSIVALPEKGKVFLYGKSKVNYGSMDMQAEYIDIDYNTSIISAYGKKDSLGKNVGTPVFRDSGEDPMEAEKITYNLKSKRGKIYNAITKQGELLVIGNEIKKDSSNIIYMKDMKCIPCQEEDARTVFMASRAKIIPDDKIVTGPMYLSVGGVPTPLGLPFGYFPNTKKQANGILLPTFGNSPGLGFNLRQAGFYWGINDRTDMIIRGDIYANGSFALNTTNNYNVLYKARGSMFLGYSRFNEGDRDVPEEYRQRQSYNIRWQHTQDNKSNPSVRFSADVNYVSNQAVNRLTEVNSQGFLQNQFMSNVSYSKNFKLSSLAINAQQNQNSQTREMNISFPTVVFNVNSFFPFKRESHVKQNALDKVRMFYTLEANNNLAGSDTSMFKGAWWHRLNYGVSQKVPISTSFNILKYITATPELNLSSTMYTKSIRKELVFDRLTTADGERDSLVGRIQTNTVKQFAAGYDANFRTSFKTQVYFDYVFKKGKVKQIRHLLIPDLNYTYRPDFGAEQYGFWKQYQLDTLGRKGYYTIFEQSIYGGPQRGEQSLIGLALNNNIEAKVKTVSDTGVSFKKQVLIQNLGANANYNFAADSFQMSTINLSARTKVLKYFDVVGNSTFDPYAYDKVNQRRISDYATAHGQSLARLVNANFSINTSLGSNMLEAIRKTREKPKISSGAERGIESDLNTGEKLPWNVSMYYTLNLTNLNAHRLQPEHNLRFSGDIMPTKNWKLGVSSGFNFATQKIEYTRLTIYRDLKCWQAQIDWVPFGISRQYNISINLKTSMLSEFKIPRQRQWYDSYR